MNGLRSLNIAKLLFGILLDIRNTIRYLHSVELELVIGRINGFLG